MRPEEGVFKKKTEGKSDEIKINLIAGYATFRRIDLVSDGGVLLAVILAKPEITLLPAPPVTQPSGKVVR
ncbi:hypothetical protein [Acidiphilium rubrum]|uniref:hypothetical protein n=1 Tax=Acidiphilium rubrum TaxID=526 RepID=UPI002C78118D|nr:hypothetical protein [Acidiphilium rubrum]HQT86713.1 hypothetical protein [Acidiphilium rubrum]